MVESSTAAAHRPAAVERLVRDLEAYPEYDRNRVATTLVMAGVEVDFRITFDKRHAYHDRAQLQVAALQGDPEALDYPGFVSKELEKAIREN